MRSLRLTVALAFATLTTLSFAQYHMMFESDQDTAGGTELYFANFDTYNDVLTGNYSSGAYSSLDVTPGYSTTGLSYDGQYRMMFESDQDTTGGTELYFATFNTFDDLLTGSYSDGAYSSLDVTPGYSTTGLTYDGQYHLMFESDQDTAGGSELYLANFDTFDDLLTGNYSSGAYSSLDVTPGYSTTGLTYDGQYHLMFESDQDTAGGSELYVANFNTFDDLLTGNYSSGAYSSLDVTPGYSTTGLVTDSVPEPGTLAILGLGAIFLRRKKH